MKRVAIYARYSSDNQRDASIEDQIRLCREHAEREGWQIIRCYTDHAISGASLIRPGIQSLIEDGIAQKFDVIVAEAMDRLSRDQEDIAGIYKRMSFADVKIVTLSEGEINNLHVGLKGTMNALFLKDLADKTRRGLRGRIEKGKSGGGNSYGYRVVKKFNAKGELVRGDRRINKQEAKIVNRIFRDYAGGKSPLAIAAALNKEGIQSPTGRGWGQSSLNGNAKRGTGILNNELYIGKLVWNRLRYVKDPDTGRRISRLNPESEWIVREVPKLRIVHQRLWNRVKARQKKTKQNRKTQTENHFRDRRRPRHLLSGLLRCGVCKGSYTTMNKDYFGCSTRHNKGTCDNKRYIQREKLERTILAGLRFHLIRPESFEAFCKAFTEEANRQRIALSAEADAKRSELVKIEKDLTKLLDTLKGGGQADIIVREIQRLESRQKALEASLASASEPPPLIHPGMAKLYQQKLERLYETLQSEETRQEAMTVLRTLIDYIEIIPHGKTLKTQITGDLAGLLTFVNGPKAAENWEKSDVWFELVAGARCLRKPCLISFFQRQEMATAYSASLRKYALYRSHVQLHQIRIQRQFSSKVRNYFQMHPVFALIK